MNGSIMNVSLQLNHDDAWSMVVVIISSLKHLSTKRSISHHILHLYNNHTLAVVVDNNTSDGCQLKIIPKKSWLIYVIQPTRLVFCISFIMISLFNIINETTATVIHEYYNVMSESGIFLCEKGIWNMLVEEENSRVYPANVYAASNLLAHPSPEYWCRIIPVITTTTGSVTAYRKHTYPSV